MRFILVLLCLFLAAPTYAAPLTVAEAVALAIRDNPRASAAAHDVRAAGQGARAAGAPANPTIVFTPAVTEGGSDTELLVAQPLELNGTRAARSAAAQARLRSADANAASEMRALVADVKTQYYELLRAKERLALGQDLLSSAEAFDVLTRKGVELGARPAVDATQSTMEVTRARQQATLAAAEADRARAALNVLMGRDVDIPIDSLEALPASFPPIDPNTMTAQSRSDIAASEATADALRQDARLARAEGKPDIAPQYRATGVTRGWQDAGFGVAITLPLLDYGDRRGRVRQSEEAARAQDDRTRALTAQAQLEVRQAVSRVQSADKVLADYVGLTAQAQSLLDASRIGYEEGKTGVGEYLTAQRTLRAVRADEIDARIAGALARAELERASGAFPAGTPKETEKTHE